MPQIERRASLGKDSAFKINIKINQVQTNDNPEVTKHKVYDFVLSCFENKQILVIESGQVLPYILHPEVKKALTKKHEFSSDDIEQVENSILRDAEYLTDFAVVRDVPRTLYNELHRRGESDAIFNKRIVAVPNFMLNALVCGELLKRFSRREILAVDGFIEVRTRDESGIIHRAVRLDIDGKLCRNGFILPFAKNCLIIALKVFRYPNDERPFILKSRTTGGQI